MKHEESENLKPVKKRNPYKKEESVLQQNCVKWFRLQYPKIIIFAIPNGGKRNVIEASKMKREGVLAGMPDLMILKPNKQKYGLFMETKSKKGKQSKEQIEVMEYCICNNYQYNEYRTFEDFVQIVTNYFKC